MDSYDFNNDLDDQDHASFRVRNFTGRESHVIRKIKPWKHVKADRQQVIANLSNQEDGQENFNFSYHASRHERQWIIDSIGAFYEQQWLDDVIRLIQGGKEAHVYQCLANPTVKGLNQGMIAAKVYRPRRFRNLKNDQLYREGRVQLDSEGREVTEDGMLHAMASRSTYGLELLHTSWIEHEVKTMEILSAAGADVPIPLASGNNAILMTYIGDDNYPAPILNSVSLNRNEAQRLFDRTVHNIDVMLKNQRVHADLSAYNILYWQSEITLIDFPQSIDPLINRQAYRIFVRDVTRVCEYFHRQGVKTNPSRLAEDIWNHNGYPTRQEIHPALLDADDERDRRIWKRQVDRG